MSNNIYFISNSRTSFPGTYSWKQKRGIGPWTIEYLYNFFFFFLNEVDLMSMVRMDAVDDGRGGC